MTRAEIKREAKEMVADFGPANTLEFGREANAYQYASMTHGREVADAILAEAEIQAERVLRFLGL